MLHAFVYKYFIEKINCGFEASIVDDRRLEATINFGFAASRPRRQVVFLDYPVKCLPKMSNLF